MPLTGARAQRLTDAVEAAAMRDLYAAAPAALRAHAIAIAGATALVVPALLVTYFNRVLGCGNEQALTSADLDAIRDVYTQTAVPVHWLQVSPCAETPEFHALIAGRGYAPAARRAWSKFLRDTRSEPHAATDLHLRAAGTADADDVAAVVATAYGMPPPIRPWFAALLGRPGWRVWVAQDGARVVACGALFVAGAHAWLGVGATLPEHRGRGAQSALLAARIAGARESGCTAIVTETGEPIAGEPNPSLANILRAGFTKVASRANFESPRA
jgi:GNAT superfamily N-acetyltransferase